MKNMNFKSCTSLLSIGYWNLDDVIRLVYIKNDKYLQYAIENELKYYCDIVIGKVVVMASKSKHPKLFDGSLD